MRRKTIIPLAACALLGAGLLVPAVRNEARARLGRATVEERLAQVGPRVEPVWAHRLGSSTDSINALVLVALKKERVLHVVALVQQQPRVLATYPILAASGELGPKLREGDHQVPEGIYPITFLNPNSRYRLSMRVGYPHEDDMLAARTDGRNENLLGSDIMLHGGAKSDGCVAIGDEAVDELFWLVARVGIDHTTIVLAPARSPSEHLKADAPTWLHARYRVIERRLDEVLPAR